MRWYLLALLPFLYAGLDFVNFKVLAPQLYTFYEHGIIDYKAAIAIYILYPICAYFLVKSATIEETMLKGMVLGFTAYGVVYHLTNMATLQGWSVSVAAWDTIWGIMTTTLMSFLMFHI